MKHASTSPNFTAEQMKAAMDAAPERIAHDADGAYDPNDRKAVEAYFKDAIVTESGGYPAVHAALVERRKRGQRGPGTRAAKEAINIRLSPDVLSAFRATGEGWQTRVDGALQDWLAKNEPATVKVRRGSK
jgi:BrnA antitoxin of type II toxin-antitoxin system